MYSETKHSYCKVYVYIFLYPCEFISIDDRLVSSFPSVSGPRNLYEKARIRPTMQRTVLCGAVFCILFVFGEFTKIPDSKDGAQLPLIVRRMLEAQRLSSSTMEALTTGTRILSPTLYSDFPTDATAPVEVANAPVTNSPGLFPEMAVKSGFTHTGPYEWISDYFVESILGHPLGIAMLATAAIGIKNF